MVKRLAALAAVALLAACTGQAGTSGQTAAPQPSASADETVEPTPSPTVVPSPAGSDSLLAMTLAKVVADELEPRLQPSDTAPRVVNLAGEVALHAGDYVLVLGEPIVADGHRWFSVGLPQDPTWYKAPVPVGWVNAGTEEEPRIVADAAACPDTLDAATLGGLTAVLAVGCFGSDPIEFTAHQAALPPDAGLGGACGFDDPLPSWLLCDHINYSWVNMTGDTTWQFLLHFDPAIGIADTDLADVETIGPAMHLVGHFNDPAAQHCVTSDRASIDGLSEWLTCASKFVVSGLEWVD